MLETKDEIRARSAGAARAAPARLAALRDRRRDRGSPPPKYIRGHPVPQRVRGHGHGPAMGERVRVRTEEYRRQAVARRGQLLLTADRAAASGVIHPLQLSRALG